MHLRLKEMMPELLTAIARKIVQDSERLARAVIIMGVQGFALDTNPQNPSKFSALAQDLEQAPWHGYILE